MSPLIASLYLIMSHLLLLVRGFYSTVLKGAVRVSSFNRPGSHGFRGAQAAYSLVFVQRRGLDPRGGWVVRDGPCGDAVLFARKREALDYARELLTMRRGHIVEA
jgi:hypothetical protein